MSKSKKNPISNSNPNCFSTIFRRLICSGDLPTYPDHDHHQINKTASSNVIINDQKPQFKQVELESVPQMKPEPGIVARLMGLESMPDNNTYTPNESLFFKSKSLNSLNFFPDFNSNKASYSAALHRRSASFSHLGSSAFSLKVEEENNSSKLQSPENRGGAKQSGKKQGNGAKAVETNLKGNERRKSRGNQKYEEGYATQSRRSVKNNVGSGRGTNLISDKKCASLVKKQGKLGGGRGVNDVGLNVSSKRRVHYDHDKEEDLNNQVVDNEVLSDSLSRSPVSVLDHHLLHLLLDYSPSKEDERRTTSSTASKKPTTKTKTKIYNEMQQEYIMPIVPKKHDDEFSRKIEGRKSDKNNQKLKKEGDQEAEIAEYFVGLLGQICRLTEERVKDPKWVAKSRGFKVHFVEELSSDFGGQILDLLLSELIDEILII